HSPAPAGSRAGGSATSTIRYCACSFPLWSFPRPRAARTKRRQPHPGAGERNPLSLLPAPPPLTLLVGLRSACLPSPSPFGRRSRRGAVAPGGGRPARSRALRGSASPGEIVEQPAGGAERRVAVPGVVGVELPAPAERFQRAQEALQVPADGGRVPR